MPYAIVRTRSELGKLVGMKTCAAVAFDQIRKEEEAAFTAIAHKVSLEVDYEKNIKTYGGNTLSLRSQRKLPQNK